MLIQMSKNRVSVIQFISRFISSCLQDEVENFGPSKLAIYQQILWDTFEKPHKSCVAKYV